MVKIISFNPSVPKFTIRFPLVYLSKWQVFDEMGSSASFSRPLTHISETELKTPKKLYPKPPFVKDLINLSLGIQNKVWVQHLAKEREGSEDTLLQAFDT